MTEKTKYFEAYIGRLFRQTITLPNYIKRDSCVPLTSCRQICTEKLQIRRVSVKFVPCLLTDDQKENRVEIRQELLANATGNEIFLKNIITGDETWVYRYDIKTKMRSSQWMGKGSPRPKKDG